jgi:exodeoxyribonuclease V alpha subunit
MTDLATSLPPGLLLDVHATGALNWADVHVAQKVAHLYREGDQRVQLALALTVRALRTGSTCLDLGTATELRFGAEDEWVVVPAELWPEPLAWRAAIEASPLVTLGPDGRGERPLRLVGDLLYLERYWQEETTVATELALRRAAVPAPVPAGRLQAARAELLSAGSDRYQVVAALVPSLTPVSVIAGGPGTGKTHTLARVLGVLARTSATPPRIALAAPTGKAAARMEEALSHALAGLPPDLAADLRKLRATTVHRLLGTQPGSRSRFRHDRTNPLPQDVVVVDEASMVSLTLMARLVDALRPDARLVLVGDPDQLAPVEAGAVLADIVDADWPTPPSLAAGLAAVGESPAGPVVRLLQNHRSSGAIAELAAAVLAGNVERVLAIASAGTPDVRFAPTVEETDLRQRVTAGGAAMIAAAEAGRVGDALAELDRHRLLCAHRDGQFGVAPWSRRVEDWLVAAVPGFDPTRLWYPGRPLLVTRNTADLGLSNGDTGVVVRHGEQLRAHFARGSGVISVSPALLDGVQTVHAMTVHKAQGSQFEAVTLVLPSPDSPLLTQELLYTAITRARDQVTLIGSPESLAQAVRSRARRASGLRQRL